MIFDFLRRFIMSGFMWGVICGAVVSPFAWVGLRWCYRKLVGVLGA